MRKYLAILLTICCFTFLLAGCSAERQDTVGTSFTDGKPEETVPVTETPVVTPTEPGTETIEEDETVNITITMQDGGIMKLELYPDKAPATVANFVKLAKEGFYNGLTFHRIIEGFMIQGGDPQGTGMGGSDENIPGEFAINGFTQNDISHVRGVISMARAQSYNSASSQFFIVHADSTYLDSQYAAFGMLTEGFDVLDRLAATQVGADGQTPLAKPVIESITVQ